MVAHSTIRSQEPRDAFIKVFGRDLVNTCIPWTDQVGGRAFEPAAPFTAKNTAGSRRSKLLEAHSSNLQNNTLEGMSPVMPRAILCRSET